MKFDGGISSSKVVVREKNIFIGNTTKLFSGIYIVMHCTRYSLARTAHPEKNSHYLRLNFNFIEAIHYVFYREKFVRWMYLRCGIILKKLTSFLLLLAKKNP